MVIINKLLYFIKFNGYAICDVIYIYIYHDRKSILNCHIRKVFSNVKN